VRRTDKLPNVEQVVVKLKTRSFVLVNIAIIGGRKDGDYARDTRFLVYHLHLVAERNIVTKWSHFHFTTTQFTETKHEQGNIYPGVPFISTDDLRTAHEKLVSTGASYVFPVTGFPSPIQRALMRLSDGRVCPFQPEHAATRTQDLEPGYFDVGQFYWGRKQAWLDGLNIHLNATTLVIPEWRVVDIDTQADWERAELLYATLSDKGLL